MQKYQIFSPNSSNFKTDVQLKTPQFWIKKNAISWILFPLSLFYCAASYLFQASKKTYRSTKPVICVGNIIAGGSGKTPTAMALGKTLREIYANQDFEFCYLSSGYKGEGVDFVALRGGKYLAKNVGDEPILLNETAPTFVAKKRVFGISQIEKINKIKAVILDDGMQDKSLYKDLVVLVVDGKIGFGNELMIPAGPMRETMKSGLRKADLVVLVGEANADLVKKLQGKLIIRANIVVRNLQDFVGKNLLAFTGLAYPDKFFSLLKKENLNLVKSKSFPDHYSYQESDLDELTALAKSRNLSLITTKKDWVKFSPKFQNIIPYLDVEMEFVDQELLKNEIKKKLKL